MYAKYLKDSLSEEKDERTGKRNLYYFKKMSQVLKGRKNRFQCRSHHQKMILRYGSN